MLCTIIVGCGSFEPIQFNYPNPSEEYTTDLDSVMIAAKVIGDLEKGRSILMDMQNSESICSIMISIKNNSNKKLQFRIYSSEGSQLAKPDEIYRKYMSPGFVHFLIWSTPWIANIASGLPIFYGVLFPIIGVIEINKSSSVNDRLLQFIEDNTLPNNALPKRSIKGLIYVKNNKPKKLSVEISYMGNLINTIEVDL